MKDIKEEILSPYRQHRAMVTMMVPANCAAGRCGHKTINTQTIAYDKMSVLNAMDKYAARILQWLHDNQQDLSNDAGFDAKKYLEEIKSDINNGK